VPNESEAVHDCARRTASNHNDHPEVIVMATNSLPQSTLDTFQPISASAVHVLARTAARKAVQEELRSEGVRVSLVKPSDISVRANETQPASRVVSGGARACTADGAVRETSAQMAGQVSVLKVHRLRTLLECEERRTRRNVR